ncbi:MAG: AAA family ATPase [Acidimicrobiales bacterium]
MSELAIDDLDCPEAGRSYPSVVSRLNDLDVPTTLLHDLVLRRILLDGRSSTIDVARALAVSPTLLEEVIDQLRDLRYLEISGREGRNLFVGLSGEGRLQAAERMRLQRYAGPVPVGLEAYRQVVASQEHEPDIDQSAMRAAFADLVVSDELLDELGPAARTKGAIFLYGPPGTGKSAIAERLIGVQDDPVLIPHAVEVDGQVILVFDPVVHEPVAVQPEGLDQRWVLCRRPCIIAGGELTLGELDLTFEESSGVYLAPHQMQANSGILVIDDLGRQSVTPEQLLNRWIVPLDRRVDYLTLSYGMKFVVPCTAKIVFSTNLEPSDLGDEAFFRRIRSKVLIPGMTDAQFDEVLQRVSTKMGVRVAADAPVYLRWLSRTKGDGDLRPYLPVAVCELVDSVCGYEHLPKRLDRDMIDRVTTLYFTQAAAMGGELGHDGGEPPESIGSTEDAWPMLPPARPRLLAVVEPPAPAPPPGFANATAF